MDSISHSASVSRRNGITALPRGFSFALECFALLAILIAGYAVSWYLRRTLPLGKTLPSGYQWFDFRSLLGLAASALISCAIAATIPGVARQTRFRPALGAVTLSFVTLVLVLWGQFLLQKMYFAAVTTIFVLLIFPRAGADVSAFSNSFFAFHLRRLWANRSLLRIWVYYNVRSRYAQTFLGVLWIILLPLTTALVLSLVFSQIMRVHIQNAPFIAFFLAGFVPWGLFNQSIGAGMRAILSAMGLINQIYFPREIIVLSALGEALLDTLFMFVAMLCVDAIVGIFPNPLYLLLPLLLLIEVALALGLMLILSWLSVLVRDIPQLVSVLLQMLFYLSPIIYPIDIIPVRYQFLVALNPIAAIVEAFHRIVVYGRPPDWLSLFYPASVGVVLLVFGYRLFKSNEDRMADLV